jgi:hypothetical protein
MFGDASKAEGTKIAVLSAKCEIPWLGHILYVLLFSSRCLFLYIYIYTIRVYLKTGVNCVFSNFNFFFV